MNNRKRASGSTVFALVAILAVVVVTIIAAIGVFVSYYNRATVMENAITATYNNNRNIYAKYTQTIMEMSQVPDMMRDDMTKVVTAALSSRYGEDGSKAVFQMIREQNPVVSEKLYLNIQTAIKSGRDEFAINQTRLTDQRNTYNTALGMFFSGTMLRIAGFPTIDLSKYDIVTTTATERVFENKKEEAIILRK